MKVATIAASALVLSSLAVEASAQYSTERELRGYETCVAAAEAELASLQLDSGYYINRSDSMNQYFVNGRATVDGARVEVSFTCETGRNGRGLRSFEAAAGRNYVLAHEASDTRVAAN